jgi:predicted nucleic acid-binding protein
MVEQAPARQAAGRWRIPPKGAVTPRCCVCCISVAEIRRGIALERFAKATGTRLRIRFEPDRAPIRDTRAIAARCGAHNPA